MLLPSVLRMGQWDDNTRRLKGASPMLEPGTLVGEFQIEGLLGEGGMGHVYLAVHPLIAKRAAIKVLRPELSRDPQMLERFVLEARAVNEIQHPNIVDIFAFGALDDGRHYFVMECLRGTSLRTLLEAGRIPLNDACEILTAISNALAASHAIGIVHRDLKPDNVFLTEIKDSPNRIVKLLDFGIAKLVQGNDRMDQTATGVFIGTPMYASPEQSRGDRVDHRTDLYALGVMAFELLTGRLPFEGNTGTEIAAKHLLEPAPSIMKLVPNIPRRLARLVDGMLEKDPARRPRLEDVREAFRDVAAMPPRVEVPPPTRRWRFAVAAGFVAAVGIGIAAIIATRSTPSLAPPPDAATTTERIEVAPAPIAQTPDASIDATEPDAATATVPPPDVDTTTATTKPAATKQRTRKRTRPKQPPKDPADPDGLL
jgi:serine/threonine protein kinase